MAWLLIILLGFSGLAWAERGFQLSTLAIPSRTYGIANEPCVSPSAGDITVSTEAALQSAAENVANANKHIFLNAGVYTLTSHLELRDGITLRPNNCAVASIESVASQIKLRSHNTLAGLTLIDVRSAGGSGYINTFATGTTGSIVRNNLIRTSGVASVAFGGNEDVGEFLIKGNTFYPNPLLSGTVSGLIRLDAVGSHIIIEDNDFAPGEAPAGVADYLSHVSNAWGGQYTIRRNWIHGNPLEDFIDIKGAAVLNSTMTIEDNYIEDTFGTAGICIMLQNGSTITGTYTAHVRGNFIKGCQKQLITHISTGETGTFDQVSLNAERNIIIARTTTGNTIELNRNGGANIIGNTIISPVAGVGEFESGDSTNPNPIGIVVKDNIFYQSLIEFIPINLQVPTEPSENGITM